MRRRVIRAAAADMMTPMPKCDLPRDQWPGTVDIRQGGQLSSGRRLVAKDNLSTLAMQPDGNLVLSLINDKGGPGKGGALWATGTWSQ
ncbi:hypothetical protein ACIA8O_16190 [Kitasatospora sp. NPDC051853]|uniref:hypothetical protein n=1 Tax=Kitasatospora sp. NPDC051853 TaxID=3364058 RepID=UPI00378DC469